MDTNSKGSENYDFGAKFGATPNEAAEIMRICKEKGFKVGLTFHPGSQNENPLAYTQMMRQAHEIAKASLGESHNEMVRLNVGGGFPCYYPTTKASTLSDYFKAVGDGIAQYKGEIICEPGRALVSDSISLLTRINLRREGDQRIYINDGFYGSFMELPFVDFMPPARAYDSNGVLMQATHNEMKPFSIWGPTCDSLDKLPKPVKLPAKIRTGDYIEFGLMGAYTNATDTGFNGIKPADMIIVKSLQDWGMDSYEV